MIGNFYVGVCPSWRAAVVQAEGLNAGTKLVLLILAEYVSGMGEMVWPGKAKIAELAGVEEKLVEKALKSARELGWLKWEKDFIGGDHRYIPTVPESVAFRSVAFWEMNAGAAGPILRVPPSDTLKEVFDAITVTKLLQVLAEQRIQNGPMEPTHEETPQQDGDAVPVRQEENRWT